MVLVKKINTKQIREECVYHKQLISCFKNEPDYQNLTTDKLNQILRRTGKLPTEYLLQRTNERYDETIAPKYEIILVDHTKQNKPSNNKNELDLVIKVLDHIIFKFDLWNEPSYSLN